MKRKETPVLEESQADWVAAQLRLSLQVLASEAHEQVMRFPSQADLIEEMIMDYVHYAESIHTYWILSPEQDQQLIMLQDFFSKWNDPLFWTKEALFSDPRWERVRDLARLALVSLQWPIVLPSTRPDV